MSVGLHFLKAESCWRFRKSALHCVACRNLPRSLLSRLACAFVNHLIGAPPNPVPNTFTVLFFPQISPSKKRQNPEKVKQSGCLLICCLTLDSKANSHLPPSIIVMSAQAALLQPAQNQRVLPLQEHSCTSPGQSKAGRCVSSQAVFPQTSHSPASRDLPLCL